MEKYEKIMYSTLKDSIRKAYDDVMNERYNPYSPPVVLIDFHGWEAFYFQYDHEAEDYLEESYADDFETQDGEDEELIIYKYCSEDDKKENEVFFRDYKLVKEINGTMIYRKKSLVAFETEYKRHAYV